MNAYSNPYAPPQAPPPVSGFAQPGGGYQTAHAEGDLLVVQNGAPLPHVCVKCAAQQQLQFRPIKFSWVPPWARLFGALIQLFVMKRSSFTLPICARCNSEWKKWNLIAWLSWLPGIGFLMLAGIVTAAVDESAGGVMMVVGFVLLLAGLVTALIMRMKHIITVRKIDKTHTWMKGIHPEALRIATTPQGGYAPPQQAWGAQAPGQPAYGAPQNGPGYNYGGPPQG